MDLKNITVFLSGSVVTFITKELFSFWHKRNEFRREIHKMTLSRKLEIAEKAIAYYYTYRDASIGLKLLFKTTEKILNNSEAEIDLTTMLELLTKNQARLEELDNIKYLDINSIHLYFEVGGVASWSEQDLLLFNEQVMELRYQGEEVEYASENLKKYTEMGIQVDVDFFQAKLQENLLRFQTSIGKVIVLQEKLTSDLKKSIENIKNQIR